jgi:two-component system CheB/CheR fusion protein
VAEDEFDSSLEQTRTDQDTPDSISALTVAAETAVSDVPVIGDGREETDRMKLPFPIVGIGGSAGSVEACIELFQNLPSATGMAYVIVPHLAADQRATCRKLSRDTQRCRPCR